MVRPPKFSKTFSYIREATILAVTGVFNLIMIPVVLVEGFIAPFTITPEIDVQGKRYKNVVITGASSGIGKEIALQAGNYGAERLLLLGRDHAKLEMVAEESRRRHNNVVEILAVDFTSSEGCMEARRAIATFDLTSTGGIDVIFSNAGMSVQNAHQGPTVDTLSTSFFHDMIQVNLVAQYEIATSVLEEMRSRGRGTIVFTSSINGMIGPANQVVYNATKAASLSLARDLRVLLKDDNVQVTAITPGFIHDTGITRPQVEEGAKAPRWATGSPQTLAKKVWRGVQRGDFLIAYPYSHFLSAKLSHSRGPLGWLSHAKSSWKVGMASSRWT